MCLGCQKDFQEEGGDEKAESLPEVGCGQSSSIRRQVWGTPGHPMSTLSVRLGGLGFIPRAMGSQ